MCEFLKSTASTILGGLISAGVGLAMFAWQRRVDAKDDFLATTADLRAKLDTYFRSRREEDYFEESLPIITQAVYRVRRFLGKGYQERLHTVLREYQSHHKSEFAGGLTRMAAAANADLGMGQTHGQLLRGFLDRFDDCIRKPVS